MANIAATEPTKEDVATLVTLVGRSGAIQALVASDTINVAQLRRLGGSLGIATSKHAKKKLAELIVRSVDKRIGKSLEELEALGTHEISTYLNKTVCDATELTQLLSEAGIPVQGKMSLASLIDFAAIQISHLGMYKRISSPDYSVNRNVT